METLGCRISLLNSTVSVKISGSGQKRTNVPVFCAALPLVSLLRDLAAGERHRVDRAVAADLHVELLRQRVDHRDADAVQAAGDRVAAPAELAAGVQDGQDHLERRAAILGPGDGLDRDAAAVVVHARGTVGVQGDDDAIAIPRHRLVDRVVDDLVDEVMQAADAGGADVHAGPFADRLESLEDLDVLGVVVGALRSLRSGGRLRDSGQTSSDRGRAEPTRRRWGPRAGGPGATPISYSTTGSDDRKQRY